MGRLIAVLAVAGAAALAVHPGAGKNARAAAAPAASASASTSTLEATKAAERDLEARKAESALSGSAPLFGAEGLPKPVK